MIKRILGISLVSLLSIGSVKAQNGDMPYFGSGTDVMSYYLEHGIKLEEKAGKPLFFVYDLNYDGIPDHYWFDRNKNNIPETAEVYCDHDEDGIIDNICIEESRERKE